MLITIISLDYLNLSLANEYIGYFTIPTRLSSITNVVPGGSANQIAVYARQIKLFKNSNIHIAVSKSFDYF